MSFSAYPSYKDSGVEWLGEVPTHWSVYRISDLYREAAEPGHDDLPILSVSIHDGVSDDEVEPDEEGRKVNRSDDRSKYKKVKPNDLVYNMMRAWQGGFGSVKVLGMVSPAYVVARPRDKTCSGLVELMLRTAGAIEEMRRRSKGVTDFRLRLYWDEFKDMRIALPPVREQSDIKNFIDGETAKIDMLVEEQWRLISLLKEKRQAVISHAVTKGLNPKAPMKHSGVEWLGEVPVHWEIVPTGYRYEVQLGRMLNAERASGEDLRPYLRVADVQWDFINVDDLPMMNFPPEARGIYRLRAGDLLVNEGGSYVGRSAIWKDELDECYYQKALHRVRPRNNRSDTSDFLLFVMEWATNFGLFVARGNQTTIDHLTAEQLRNHKFAFPPADEQREISLFLRNTITKIERLRLESEGAIALLSERRAALISAAVTGRIDVRGTSQILPPTVDRARARGLIAAEIIELSAHQVTFGRVKLQKISYLAETHAGVTELGGAYLRAAAGPLDREMIREMESEAGALTGVRVEQPNGAGSAVAYRLGADRGAHKKDLAALLGNRAAKFDKLIEDIGTIDTKAAEAVATLYAVWNDAVIDGDAPSDMEIKLAFLNEWHPEKAKKFRLDELQVWLDWMRRHGLVPTGTGPKTSTGRLFV